MTFPTLQRIRELNNLLDRKPTKLTMHRDTAQYDVLPGLMMEHRKEILKALEAKFQREEQKEMF